MLFPDITKIQPKRDVVWTSCSSIEEALARVVNGCNWVTGS